MQNNILFEMIPLIGFFIVYYISKNIFLATLVCILASWAQVILTKMIYKKVAKNTLLSTLLITIFGGLTIILHNKTFVMLKPTVLYWIIAISLFVSAKMGKNGIKLLLKEQIVLEEKNWDQVNLLWIFFFTLMGVINLIVAFNFSENVWVNFKVFGGAGLIVIFTAITGVFIYSKANSTVKRQ